MRVATLGDLMRLERGEMPTLLEEGIRLASRSSRPLEEEMAGSDPVVLPPFEPLVGPATYKGAKGGRSAGRSHFFAEQMVHRMRLDPDLRCLCVREVQRSLKYSAKVLIEDKIADMGLSSVFRVMTSEIHRIGGRGRIIFQGMQDHTADTIKSLEGFGVAWVEEAQSISQRSLSLLTPTIRAADAEMWFSWNPRFPDDPIEALLVNDPPEDAVVVHSTYLDNPLCPEKAKMDAERLKRASPDDYAHVWLGEFDERSDSKVLAGRYRVEDFEPTKRWDGPYFGADWGFSQDPTALTRSWIHERVLYVEYEAGGVGIGWDGLGALFAEIPGAGSHRWRADNSHPQTIDYLARNEGLDIIPAKKWSGSVEEGVTYLRSFSDIVIHPRCVRTEEEARKWAYKTDRLTGDPLPKLADGWDHYWDSIRYAHEPMIEQGNRVVVI